MRDPMRRERRLAADRRGSLWGRRGRLKDLAALAAGLAILSSGIGDARAQPGEPDYEACLDLAARDPRAARDLADGWLEQAGGNSAWHCLAEARRNLGEHAAAARDFAVLAREMALHDPQLAVPFALQAVDAWLAAGDPALADELIVQVMGEAGPSADLWIAAAHVAAARDDWRRAVDALSQALLAQPGSRDALLLRAAAHRRLGDYALGLDDAERGLQIAPGDPSLLLERGNLRLLADDAAGARSDWQAVIAASPDSPPAAAARANLDRLQALQ